MHNIKRTEAYPRRKVIKGILAGIGAAALMPGPLSYSRETGSTEIKRNVQSGWELVPAILKRIKPPVFPSMDFAITSFGAVGDGKTDCNKAFAKAIQQCNAAGGGSVTVPSGTWRSDGPIHLKANVNLHLKEGATIRFNPDPDLYLPLVLTRWAGTEMFNYSPFIYACQATNVAITGQGVIDGRAKESFATWKPGEEKAEDMLRQMGAEGIPVHERVFGKGHWLRPSMVQFFGCRNVLVEGITVLDSPFWVIHPVYRQNVTVRNLYVKSHNTNNDGVDPDSSVDVLIENCHFQTGDDGVAIKSGRDQDAWRVGQPTENIIVRNCDMDSKANGLCIGSEMSGGVRNVFMENCRVGKVDSAIYFKGNLDRGGTVEHVRVRDITVERTDTLIHFTTDYHGYRGGHYPPTFRDFLIENMTCKETGTAIDAVGVPGAPLQDITLRNIKVQHARVPYQSRHVEDFVMENVTVGGELITI